MSAGPASAAVVAFAAEVGPADAGPVTVVGGSTQWHVGGAVDDGVRQVRAPVGVVAVEPADLTVRVRAGTAVADLQAVLSEHGQCVALPTRPGATVGGVLAVGRSGLRQLGWGPVRDTVLQATAVGADGVPFKAGGPTVKNVSGFDLCRILVGSMGTLGFLAEVVLRTRPLPAEERWLGGEADPFRVLDALYRPASVLWDGRTTWALLDGHPADVAAQADVAASLGLAPVAGGVGGEGTAAPVDCFTHRWSVPPAAVAGTVAEWDQRSFVAELGVGIIHTDRPPALAPMPPATAAVHQRLKAAFDPTGRLNPGRHPEGVAPPVITAPREPL